MHKKLLIFDFDLTLADATAGIFECSNHALSKLGFPSKDFETIKRTIGYTLPDSFSMLTGNLNPELAEQYVKEYVKHADKVMNNNTHIYPEVFGVIPKLKQKGYSLAIVSTKYRYRITGILERDKLNIHFDYIVGGEDVKSHKPDPEGLILTMEKAGIDKSQALYVGDSIVDAMAAKHAGIDFCAVLTGTSTLAEFHELNAFQSIHNLSEFIPFLENIHLKQA